MENSADALAHARRGAFPHSRALYHADPPVTRVNSSRPMPTTLRASVALLILLSAFSTLVQQHNGAVSAAECTSAQLAQILVFNANSTKACDGASITSVVSASAYCGNPTCLAYILSVASQVPYCDVQGFNVRAVLAMAATYCEQRSNASDAVSYTPQPNAAPKSLSVVVMAGVLVLAVVASAVSL
uniref:Elicitin-like protein n=1 Tax=Globisporangium ultimum (strain ATCC 200006 / CBS 805.95 / DAOM BR144) TaxID=431595 RepID=K3W5R0_GLOUD